MKLFRVSFVLFALVIANFCWAQEKPAPPTASVTKAKSAMEASSSGHQAVLSWSQSVTTGVDGNNVYQSITNGGPYTKIFSSPVPITTYTVTTGLQALTTYYWVVTATCSKCNPVESDNSNQVSGTTVADAKPDSPQSLVLSSIK